MQPQPIALHPEPKAREIAAANNKDAACELEPWTYIAIPWGNYFVVEVRDEDAVLVGYL